MGEKQKWNNDQLKCLLETCIDEVNTVGRKGLSLQKDSWTKLGRILKEKFGMDLSQKQMKNAYDNLKAKYVGWVYLRNKTGNIYNPQTNTFSLTTEEWDDFKKGHPKAAALKTIPLPFPELCATLFDGNSTTGNCKWTSTQSASGGGSYSCNRVQTLHIMDNPFNEIEDDDSTSQQTSAPTANPPPNVDHSPSFDDSPNVEHSPTPDRPTKKPKPSKPSSTNKEGPTVDDLALDMQKALQHLVNNKDGPTVDECYEKLKLCHLDSIDPIFLATFHIFGVSMNMREAWMTCQLFLRS